MPLMVTALLPATLAVAQSPFFQAVTNLNPIAYWPLQETTQPPAADVETNLGSLGAVGNAYYSSTNVVKGVTGINSGDSDPAIGLTTTNGGFLAVPLTDSRVALPTGPFTVEAWVEPTLNVASTIIAQTGVAGSGGLNGSTNSAGWSLNLGYVPTQGSLAVPGTVSFHVYNGVGPIGGAEAIFSQSGFALNQWYHVVAVFDGTNAVIYVNDVAGSPEYPLTGTQARDTWDPLTIGCGRGLNNNRFGGNLDEVAIYTNALTASQIGNHYNVGTQGAGGYESTILADKPYLYWRLNAPAYTTPAASAYPTALNYGTGTSINGLYLSGTTPGVSGPSLSGFGSPSYAVAFNGIGTSSTNVIPIYTNGVAYATNTVAETGVIITNLLSGINLITNNLSLLYWFKSNPSDNVRRVFVGHGDSSWRSSMSGGDVTANTGKGSDLGTSLAYNDGNWHFATVVYSNSLAHVNTTGWLATNYIYVDGTLIASAAVTNASGSGSFTNISIGVAPDHIRTGNGNVYDNQVFAGSLAHVAFFTNALSPAQVAGLYQAAGGTPLPVITGQPTTGRTNGVAGDNGSGPGSYVYFGVTTIGATTYQWFFNNTASYSGATALVNPLKYSLTNTAQVTVSNLVDGDSGYYFVVVGSGSGYATSSLASFRVYNEPVISQTPPGGSLQLFQGQNYTLSVTALFGETNFTYQWFTNGTADTTAGTSSTYTLTSVQPAASGTTYQCVVANIAGAATNSLVTLSVAPLPAALTNSLYASNILALSPSGYWPLHDSEPAVTGAVETNLGSLGQLANGYYADWAGNLAPTGIVRQVSGALTNDPDPAVGFNDSADNGAVNYPAFLVIPRTSPATTLTPPFAIEAWAKPYNSGFGDIVSENGSLGGVNNQNDGVRLGWGTGTGGAGTQGFTAFIGNGSARNSLPGYPTAYPVGQWYHVVLTFDGATWILYVNGNAVVNQPTNATYNLVVDAGSPIAIASGLWSGTGPGRCFPGAIDEVAIYTNILQPGDVATHYNDGISGAAGQYKSDVLSLDPIVYLRMDAPAYRPPPVSTWPVATNYGTIGGNAVYSPGSLPGAVAGPNALGLANNRVMPGNGMSSYVDAGTAPAFDPVNFTSFSYSVWFKGNPGDSRSFQSLISANDSTWRCSLNGSSKIQAHGAGADITSPLSYNDGNWHQVVVTCQGISTNALAINSTSNNLYVDGTLVISAIASSNNPAASPGPDVLIGDETGLTNNPYGLGRNLAGSVCEAAFWNGVALSSNQVATLYNASGTPPTITAQPISAAVNASTSFTNSVAVYGSNPLLYQWYRNGQPLPTAGQADLPIGGTNASLVINPVATNDASSDYYVIITNQFGSVTSSIVALTVFGPPNFTNEPILVTYTNDIVLFSNVAPTFKVATVGAQPVYYKWYTNGVPATSFATNLFTYTIPPVQLGGGGVTNFFCVASNFLALTTNNPVSITGIAAPTAPYPVAVLGSSPIGYWRLDEPDDELSDGNPGTLANDYWGGQNGVYTNTTLGQAGYTANNTPNTDPTETSAEFGFNSSQDSDAYGIGGVDFSTPTNFTATFSVEAWVNGYQQTKDAGIVSKGWGNGGEQFNLDTGSDSLASHGFRFFVRDSSGGTHAANSAIVPSSGNWYHLVGVCDESNGVVTLYVNGAVAGSSPITPGSGILSSTRRTIIGSRPSNSTTNDNDSQFVGNINDVSIYNYALSAAQVGTHYAAAGVPPNLSQVPPAIIVTNGFAFLSIPAVAVGTPPLTYSWLDVGSNTTIASGSTNGALLNATLTVSNVPLAWNGDSLQLTVNNAYGSTNITIALTVLTNAPVFTVNLPPQVSVVSGRTYNYVPGLVGPQPYGFQWYAGSSLIPGQTGPTLSLVGGAPGTSTNFTLVVTNIFGAVTSSVSTFVSIGTNTYAGVVAGLNPVGYWPLQETTAPAPVTVETNYGKLGSLGNAYYAFTNNSAGTQIGTVALQQGGVTADGDNAASFSGAAVSFAWVPRTTPALTLRPPITLEAWINTSSLGFNDIFGEGGGSGYDAPNNGGTYGGIRLSYAGNNAGGPALAFYVANGNGTTRNEVLTPANSLPTGQWHHCVATYDGTNTLLYIDGVLQASDSSSLAGANTENPDTWSPLTLGGAFWQSNNVVMSPGRNFIGTEDEIAVYTNILTSTQISTHYAAVSGGNYPQTITNDGAVLYYRMDCQTYTNPPATSYPIAVNYGSAPEPGFYQSGSSPGAVAGPPITTLGSNTVVVAAPGNGIISGVDANTDPSFNVTGTNKFSAVVWFKGYPADPRLQTVISHGATNWALNLDGTTGKLVWSTGTGGSITSANVLNDGNWHFLAGVDDGRTNYLYVDGILNAAAALAGGLTGEPTAHVYLGGNQDYSGVLVNQRYLNGAIAEAALFTNALTAGQVSQLYQGAISTGVPVIVTNVQSPFLVMPGYAVSNSVAAIGQAPLAYQWTYNGAGLTDNGHIVGSQTNVLTINNAVATDAGNYQVIVTNSLGSATSSVAPLIVGSLPVVFNVSGPGWQLSQSGTYSEPGITNGLLTLSDSTGSQSRSFFFQYPQYIGAFIASFTYQAGGNKAADGVTFCIQNDPRGPSALGGAGGALGVSGIIPSAELELHIYASTGVGYAFDTNGAAGPYVPSGSVNLASGDPINVKINYADGQLSLTLTDAVASTSFSTNLQVGDLTEVVSNDVAYVGFTGADGGSTSIQTITNFVFISIPPVGIEANPGNSELIVWPAAVTGYQIQQNGNLATTNWTYITNGIIVTNGLNRAAVPLNSSNAFYRLILPNP